MYYQIKNHLIAHPYSDLQPRPPNGHFFIANAIVPQYKIEPWILSSSDNQVSKTAPCLYYGIRVFWNPETSSYSYDKYQHYKELEYMDRNRGGGYALCRD